MGSVVESLEKLEGLAKERGLSLGLRPGASADAIAKAEQALGRALPSDYRELLTFADGQTDEPGFPWMPGCDRLAPVAMVVAQLAEERAMTADFPPSSDEELDGWIRHGRYHPNRLPIAGTRWWDGDTTYLDLEPGSNGKTGQLITLTSECDFVVLGESLAHALSRYVDALTSGDLVWHADEKALAARGSAPFSGHPAYAFALVK